MLDPERTLDAMQALQIPVRLKERLQSSFRKFYLVAQCIENIAKSGHSKNIAIKIRNILSGAQCIENIERLQT